MRWREEVEVEVTTLDALIAAHGVPAFCKIDVEGYEHAVLEGLSRPLPGLSLEYLPAALDPALVAIARLNRLATYRFNRSVGESMTLGHSTLAGRGPLGAELKRLPRNDKAGRVYAFLDDRETSR